MCDKLLANSFATTIYLLVILTTVISSKNLNLHMVHPGHRGV